ncbi:hypothetical protein MCEJIRE27_01257 [Candidatus Nanopelagicaceae bacterium]
MDNYADLSGAPRPIDKTLEMRKNVLFQFWRFVSLNVRMVAMIFKGDH